jgi:hypothetical protein
MRENKTAYDVQNDVRFIWDAEVRTMTVLFPGYPNDTVYSDYLPVKILSGAGYFGASLQDAKDFMGAVHALHPLPNRIHFIKVLRELVSVEPKEIHLTVTVRGDGSVSEQDLNKKIADAGYWVDSD